MGISRGAGLFKPKDLPWKGYGYFLEQHNTYINERENLYLIISPPLENNNSKTDALSMFRRRQLNF
jgi:hypothetical protein